MCSPVFNNKESIWFVGGRGNGSGGSYDRGGCTRQWWDNQSDKAAAMTKLMTSNGGPIVSLEEAEYTGDDEDTVYSAGAFVDVEVGMVAYVIENGDPDENVATGRYEITAVTDDEITLDGINGADCDVDINIGGAFGDLDTAIDDTSAGSHSVTIYTNRNETLSDFLLVSTAGSRLNNTFKRIIGYNTVPGDMSRGGAYYESPLEILQNGSIDASKCRELYGDSAAWDLLEVEAGIGNFTIENIHFKGTTGNAINFDDSSPVNIVFRNCRFSEMVSAVSTGASHILIDSCYSHDDLTWTPYNFSGGGSNCVVLNCVSNIGAGNVACWQHGSSGAAIGNISVGGNFGYRVSSASEGSGVLIACNTMYAGIICGILLDGGDSAVIFNNIFCLAPGAVGINSRNGGSVPCNDYNCFIESDGTPLTPTGTDYSGGETPVMGPHSVQVDPDFVDAANGEFRVRNPLVLRGGKPDAEGNATQMGAVLQEYQFAERARVMNAGRAGIVR